MWDNKYYTLKEMTITLVILLMVAIFAIHQSNVSQKKVLELKKVIDSQQIELASYRKTPKWLVDAYNKSYCSKDVPDRFKKECLIYEINLKG